MDMKEPGPEPCEIPTKQKDIDLNTLIFEDRKNRIDAVTQGFQELLKEHNCSYDVVIIERRGTRQAHIEFLPNSQKA